MHVFRTLFKLTLCTIVCSNALADLHVLEVNSTPIEGAEVKFLIPSCKLLNFETGPGLRMEEQTVSPYVNFTGWTPTGDSIRSIISSDEYIEFVCYLPMGTQRVTAIDLYAYRQGSGTPTHFAIAAKGGQFSTAPEMSEIRGSVALPMIGESPDVGEGKLFEPTPVDPKSPVFTFRFYPKGVEREDRRSSSGSGTLSIDAIVIHSSREPLPSEVSIIAPEETRADAPTKREAAPEVLNPSTDEQTALEPGTEDPSKSVLPGKKKALPLVSPKAKPATPKTAVPLTKVEPGKNKDKSVEVVLRPEEPMGTPITLELGREAINGELTPTGMIEGDARIVSAGVGDGCDIVVVSEDWFSRIPDADFLIGVVSYRGWASDPNGGRMYLPGAIQNQIYSEYTLEFGPSVTVINAIVTYSNRRSMDSPWRFHLFTFNGTEAPEFSPEDANGNALINIADTAVVGQPMSLFKPIELGVNRTVTFRFYFSGHPAMSEYNNSTVNFDKIVFFTD